MRQVDLRSLAEMLREKVASAGREEVIGIPSRATSHELPSFSSSRTWEFGVHDHDAEKRGRHFDLRLGDRATGRAHSWALPTRLPRPGESLWAVQQPTHTVRYMDFEGRIPEGYGAGEVKLHARDQAEVLRSKPGHLVFHIHRPTGTEEFVLHRIHEKMWKLINRTPTRAGLGVPTGKPDYRQKDPDKFDLSDERYVMSAKIDDAHNLFVLPPDGKVRVVSHRAPTRSTAVTDVIDHSHKVPGLADTETPSGLGGTILRGGLYAIDKRTGKAMEAHILGGLLNTDVWKSREKQKAHGHLRPVLYDIEQYRGKDVSKAPYSQKLELLRRVQARMPIFELPPMALEEKDKQALLAKIRDGKLKQTEEGVVMWRLDQHEPPTKLKFKDEHDVHIRGFFAGEGKYAGKGVGGFTFSHTPGGPVVGKVGTGLSDAQRADMHEHPERYLGMVATVGAMTKYQSGALRAPAFKKFHLDKNEQHRLDLVRLK